MKRLLSLAAMITLFACSGCVIHEHGGGYDPYYHGYGHGYHYWDRDHWDHDHWH